MKWRKELCFMSCLACGFLKQSVMGVGDSGGEPSQLSKGEGEGA